MKTEKRRNAKTDAMINSETRVRMDARLGAKRNIMIDSMTLSGNTNARKEVKLNMMINLGRRVRIEAREGARR